MSTETVEVDGRGRVFHDYLLDKLVGKWRISGNVVGRELQQLGEVKWVLNHQFLQLHFLDVSPADPKDPTPKYEALVYIGYDNMSERYVIFWLDIFGGRFAETMGLRHKAIPRRDNVRFPISRWSTQKHFHSQQGAGDLDYQDSAEERIGQMD